MKIVLFLLSCPLLGLGFWSYFWADHVVFAWKRTTRAGAIAGMLSGAGMVFLWKLVLKPLGGIFGIYELFPAFVVSCVFILFISLMTEEPSEEIKLEFEQARNFR